MWAVHATHTHAQLLPLGGGGSTSSRVWEQTWLSKHSGITTVDATGHHGCCTLSSHILWSHHGDHMCFWVLGVCLCRWFGYQHNSCTTTAGWSDT